MVSPLFGWYHNYLARYCNSALLQKELLSPALYSADRKYKLQSNHKYKALFRKYKSESDEDPSGPNHKTLANIVIMDVIDKNNNFLHHSHSLMIGPLYFIFLNKNVCILSNCIENIGQCAFILCKQKIQI